MGTILLTAAKWFFGVTPTFEQLAMAFSMTASKFTQLSYPSSGWMSLADQNSISRPSFSTTRRRRVIFSGKLVIVFCVVSLSIYGGYRVVSKNVDKNLARSMFSMLPCFRYESEKRV